jgi:XTP/dITP diphosphohydrolase
VRDKADVVTRSSILRTVVIASRNPGKLAELRSLLSTWGIAEVRGIEEFPGVPEAEEKGASYAENARGKAVVGAGATGLPTLGEDSGLEVDALGGRPGIYSARYGGRGLSDAERVARLLAELEGVPEERRTAVFHAVAVLRWPDGRTVEGAGECSGRIAVAARGSRGFGYDPVFIDPESGITFSEMSQEQKARVDHRGRALRALKKALVEGGWLGTEADRIAGRPVVGGPVTGHSVMGKR